MAQKWHKNGTENGRPMAQEMAGIIIHLLLLLGKMATAFLVLMARSWQYRTEQNRIRTEQNRIEVPILPFCAIKD